MLFNVEKMVTEYVEKMKPEQIGHILISALKSFDKLPKRQQEEVKNILKSIME